MDFKLKITDPSDLFGGRIADENQISSIVYEMEEFGGIVLGPNIEVHSPDGNLIDTAVLKLNREGKLSLVRRKKEKTTRKKRKQPNQVEVIAVAQTEKPPK